MEKAQDELLVLGEPTLAPPIDNLDFFLLLFDLEEELPSENFDIDLLEGDSSCLTTGDSGLDLDFFFLILFGQERLESGGVQPRLDLSELWLEPATCRPADTSCWASRNCERSSSSSISGGDGSEIGKIT